ncbi:hypothetical protein BS50DRAFT_640202 [Corynespora cassiicola Philippines]|uniref:Uncharacterized protein n=1 Tax=Corynespora cassiicola Philippines TaxID=1448308 RepID=A0A2T2N4Z7_CORCC|nr:hypothetical protein BS50DRAFT_640202 [Corynespora cassiicola Philippines]
MSSTQEQSQLVPFNHDQDSSMITGAKGKKPGVLQRLRQLPAEVQMQILEYDLVRSRTTSAHGYNEEAEMRLFKWLFAFPNLAQALLGVWWGKNTWRVPLPGVPCGRCRGNAHMDHWKCHTTSRRARMVPPESARSFITKLEVKVMILCPLVSIDNGKYRSELLYALEYLIRCERYGKLRHLTVKVDWDSGDHLDWEKPSSQQLAVVQHVVAKACSKKHGLRYRMMVGKKTWPDDFQLEKPASETGYGYPST